MFILSQDNTLTGNVELFNRDYRTIHALVENKAISIGDYDSEERAIEIIKEINSIQTSMAGMYCSYIMPQE